MMAENSHLISKMPERETGLPNTYRSALAEILNVTKDHSNRRRKLKVTIPRPVSGVKCHASRVVAQVRPCGKMRDRALISTAVFAVIGGGPRVTGRWLRFGVRE